MNIQLLGPHDHNKWNHFVESTSNASVYHLSEWGNQITHLFGHEAYYLYMETNDGNIGGILPMIRLKSILFGDYMVSMPYFNYGSVIGKTTDIENGLIEYAFKIGAELGIDHIEFRDTIDRSILKYTRLDKVSMILELPSDPDTMWKKLGSKKRAQINRPLRESPIIKEGSIELLDDYYRVFSENMRDLGTPVYSKRFFHNIITTFPKYHHLIVIYLSRKPVAAAFLLGFKEQLEIPWASSLKKANPVGINMLLYWHVIKYAIETGYKYIDFGRSTKDSGTYRFKKQWRAKEKQLFWHYWLKNGTTLPRLSPDNPKYRLAIEIWKKLPLVVTNLIGPNIVKNLP